MTPITLYVKPYIRKFILRNYGKEPVYVRADNDIGILMKLAILRDNYLALDDFDVEQSFGEKAKDLVKIKFALSFRVSQGKLTNDNLLRLADALEVEFKKALYFFVRGLRVMKVSESKAVKTFLELYNIDEEMGLKLDTAIKIAQRARAEKEERSDAYL